MKKREAPLACILRISHPYCTSRVMWATDENASEMSGE